MIEKLERYIREEDGIKISCPPDNVHIISKINELVDAVNTIQIEQLSAELQATRQYVSDVETKLERTRKALDRAKWWLHEIVESHRCTPISTAEMALAEITALEQKESAFVHNKMEFPEYNDGLLEEFDKQFFENGQDDDLTETALEQKE